MVTYSQATPSVSHQTVALNGNRLCWYGESPDQQRNSPHRKLR